MDQKNSGHSNTVCRYCGVKLIFDVDWQEYAPVKIGDATLDLTGPRELAFNCEARGVTFEAWLVEGGQLRPHEPVNQTDILKTIKKCLK